MKDWLGSYVAQQKAALDSIPLQQLEQVIELFRKALAEDRQIFVFGNGGSAANASHFATDLGKGVSDKLDRRFRIFSLNDNTPWMTALGNDYSYDEVFSRQLANYGRAGDLVLTMSVSGSSPNLVKALEWSKKHGLTTVALVGEKRGPLAKIADHVVAINSGHYGRVEDAHMGICHMICYAMMENPALFRVTAI